MTPIQEQLSQLEKLNFTGKGEAFVESRFITPLLQCLGYETHEDYEVIRHGDHSSSITRPWKKGHQGSSTTIPITFRRSERRG
jgi:hypothetical protein